MDVNLKGSFLCSRAVGREMIKRRRGVVVNIASISGIGAWCFSGSYSPSKAGLISLTQQLALEWAKYNVRVNAICPGFIRTPLSEKDYSNQRIHEYRKEIIPLGRIGKPDDVGRAALFLASENASYITGQTLVVDGGLLLMLGAKYYSNEKELH